MKREVRFISGYNCIDFECKFNSKRCFPNSGGSHGKHGLEIVFYVYGEKGVVQFKLSTGWIPQKVEPSQIGYRRLKFDDLDGAFPMAIDLGYHSLKPMYEGHSCISNKCEFLKGKPCYYDGSSLNANDAFYTLINAGEEALWEFLEGYYKCVFEKGKYPNVSEYSKETRKDTDAE